MAKELFEEESKRWLELLHAMAAMRDGSAGVVSVPAFALSMPAP